MNKKIKTGKIKTKKIKTEKRIFWILLDDEGHSERELATRLKRKESNLNRILNDLEKRKIIIRGEPRLSRDELTKNGNIKKYQEIPYYLNNDISSFCDILKFLTHDTAASNIKGKDEINQKLWDIGTLAETNYLAHILEKYYEYDILECIMEETGSTQNDAFYTIFKDQEIDDPRKSVPDFSKIFRGIRFKAVRDDESVKL